MAPNWHAASLRVSLFTRTAPKLADADWEKLTGQEEAESRNAVVGGGRVFGGSALGGYLTLANPGPRIDCILNPPQAIEALNERRIATLGRWSDSLEVFRNATSQWIPQLDIEIVRIAFGCTLLWESENREEAYSRLAGLIKSATVTPKMHDFFFRVNWRVESRVADGLEYNRLVSFSAVKVGQATYTLVGASPPKVDIEPQLTADFVRLDMDHNTPQEEQKAFDREQAVSIYRELMWLADQNAEVGEVR